MKPIPIAQYLNRFERAAPTHPSPPKREAVLLAPRILPTREEVESRVEAQVAEAFERGRQQGFAEARDTAAANLERDLADREEHARADRLVFQNEECAKLADRIASGLAEVETRVAESVARILKPYLAQEQAKRVTQSLSENLNRILSGEFGATLKISGPDSILAALRDRLAAREVQVEYCLQPGVDLTVEAQHTVIRTQLQAWTDLINSLGD